MRRLALTMAFLTAAAFSWAGPADAADDALFLLSLGRRDEGTVAEKEAVEYILRRLEETGHTPRITPLNRPARGHSFSRNIEVTIPGEDPGTMIWAAPIDGGAMGGGLLLEAARHFADTPPRVTLRLLFLGGEKGTDDLHPYGSRVFLEEETPMNATAMVYLEGDRLTEKTRIRPGNGGWVSPSWLIGRTAAALAERDIPFRLRGTDIQVARLGLDGPPLPLGVWLEAEIPSIVVTGEENGSGVEEADQSIRRYEKAFDALVAVTEDADGIPTKGDTSYLYLRAGTRGPGRMMGEVPYILLFLAASATIILFSLLNARNIRLNIRRYARTWWAWPLLFFLTFLFLFLGTLILEEATLLKDFPEAWSYEPEIFLFFKLAIAVTLSLIFLLLLRGLPLPRTPHYWSYAAAFTAMLDVLITAAVDVTLSAYYLWALLFLYLFTVIRRPFWKYVSVAAAVAPYIAGLLVIVREPYEEILRLLILSRINGNVVLTLLILPGIFALTSLGYWRQYYLRTRSNVTTPALTFTVGLTTLVTFVWILNLSPFGPENPQPVTLNDYIDLTYGIRRVEITSPVPVGNAVLTLEEREYPLVDLGRNAEVRAPLERFPLETDIRSLAFLGRRNIRVLLEGEESPTHIRLRLDSEERFTLHSSSWPFEVSPGGDSATIFVGRNPPLPLEVLFTVNRAANPTLLVEVEWDDPVFPPDLLGEHLSNRPRRSVRHVLDLLP